MQSVLDWLFRIGVYRGVKVTVPLCLITTYQVADGQLLQSVTLMLNEHHHMAAWLLDDCDGPWAIRVRRTKHDMTPYLSFARVADAMLFSLLR